MPTSLPTMILTMVTMLMEVTTTTLVMMDDEISYRSLFQRLPQASWRYEY
jgi:hypothetical protein